MPTTELDQLIIELEQKLFEDEVRLSADLLSQYLADDFVEIASTGVSFGKAHALSRLPTENPPEIKAWDFNVRWLAEDVALLTYQSELKREQPVQYIKSRRSSIWQKNSSGWQMAFHQGTRVE